MKHLFTCLHCLLLFSLPMLAQQTVTGTIEHDGLTRNYRLFVPTNYTGNESVPLVFNLHGYTSNALEQEFYSDMNPVADTAGFLVCYPNGINQSWNVEFVGGSTADDVGFISALIDSLALDYNINLANVYSCGMSNGGFMSYRLACELNDRIRAIASVTGSMVPDNLNSCVPNTEVPVLQMHGTDDPIVPYAGLANVSRPIDETMTFWVANNGCAQGPDTSLIPDNFPGDLSTAFRVDYSNCTDDAKVSLFVLENGEHTWPGALLTLGVTNRDIHGSEEIWLFFKQYNSIPTAIAPHLPPSQTIAVYPNPTTGQIRLKDPSSSLKGYELLNINGQVLIPFVGNPSATIKLDDLKPGVYLLKLYADDGTFVEKIQKW